MHHLPVSVALVLSLVLGAAAATFVMPPRAIGDETTRAARDRCEGYALLHAGLSDIQMLGRFVDRMAACIEAVRRP